MADDPTIGGHSRWFTLAVLFGLLFVLFASILAVGAIDSPGPGVALAGQGGEGGGGGRGAIHCRGVRLQKQAVCGGESGGLGACLTLLGVGAGVRASVVAVAFSLGIT